MKVLVTDAHYKHTLGAVRALSAEQVEVHAGSHLRNALTFYSKHVRKRFLYPNPTTRGAFVHAIEELENRENYDAILPIGYEAWFSLATANSKSLDKKIPMPPIESYLVACNKVKTLRLAKQLGMPIPETAFPENTADSRIPGLRYPLVVKRALGAGGKLLIYDASEALAYHKQNVYDCNPFVIQEFVPGEGYGFFALYNKGSLRVHFMHKRIREVPPSGGPSSAAESIYSPDLFALGSRILDALSWHGVAMVEFRKDANTGEFKLMEINPKFWGSLDLAIASGINFPYLAASLVTMKDVKVPTTYKLGLRYCWPIPDDALHLLARPEAVLSVVRDWTNFSVKKNVWLSDMAPQFCQSTMEIGKRTFSSVQTVKSRFSTRPQRFGWVVPNRLAASGKPSSMLQMIWLKSQVRAIVDLTEDAPLPRHWLQRFGGIYRKIPMKDHEPPSLKQLCDAVDFISGQINHGYPVLVHCRGGLGRTGTVLACFLVKNNEMTAQIAFTQIRSMRPGSIEPHQEESIFSYWELVNANSIKRR
jgi:predicted ATP-grasp superfamily ATP-dependent carboligase